MQAIPAGKDVVNKIHVSETNRNDLYRREPCEKCPWRKDATGVFDAEAFRVSANTTYDQSRNVFACHSSGPGKPTHCAGFLMRGSMHNRAVADQIALGEVDPDQVSDGGLDLHESYHAMAVANGVAPDDPVITPCMSNNDPWR